MIEKYKSRRIRVALRRALMSHWDPIGVKDEPYAADEYDRYIGGVFELLVDQATAGQIEEYLRVIETERMGLTNAHGAPLMPAEVRAAAVAELQRVFHEKMLSDDPGDGVSSE